MNAQPTSEPLLPVFDGMTRSELTGMICVIITILIIGLAIACTGRNRN